MGEWSKAQRELSLEVTEKNLYPYKEPDKIIETLRHASVHKNEQSDFFPENIGVSSSISRQKGPRIQASDKEIWEMLRFLTAWLFSGFVYGGAVGEEKFISLIKSIVEGSPCYLCVRVCTSNYARRLKSTFCYWLNLHIIIRASILVLSGETVGERGLH